VQIFSNNDICIANYLESPIKLIIIVDDLEKVAQASHLRTPIAIMQIDSNIKKDLEYQLN
jgi:hypothetical protein